MSGKANLGKDFGPRGETLWSMRPEGVLIFFSCAFTGFDLGCLVAWLLIAWLLYGNFQSPRFVIAQRIKRNPRITRVVACEGFMSSYFQEIGKRPHGQNKLGAKASFLRIAISMGLGQSRLLLLSGKPTWNPSMPNHGDFDKGGAPCAPGHIEGNLKTIITSGFKVYALEYFFEVTHSIYYPRHP